jgi:F-type H+-transporting ATPase subunit delta
MSRESIVAKRYARALFEVAKDKGQISLIEKELKAVSGLIQENADFEKLLKHPNISAADKLDMIGSVFQGKVSEAVFNTLRLLVDRGRETILAGLVDEFVKIANDALGQATAIVATPGALSKEEEQQIAERFGQLTGKKIRVEHVTDPSLLGGMKVRIGDRLYDGSLSGRLARLQQTLQTSQAL